MILLAYDLLQAGGKVSREDQLERLLLRKVAGKAVGSPKDNG